MADPVRVNVTVKDQPGVVLAYHVNPDDLARAILFVLATDAGQRAIRESVDARLRELAVHVAKLDKSKYGEITPASIIEWLAAPREPAQDEPAAGAWDVKGLVDRFLAWKLPRSVCADLCATRQQEGRSGTNLLSADEARQMIEHLLATPPAAPDPLLPGLRAARDVGRPIFQSCHRLANWMPEGRLRDEMLAIARAVEGLEKAPTAAAERARWLACRRMVNGEPHGWSITRLNEVADGAEGERA